MNNRRLMLAVLLAVVVLAMWAVFNGWLRSPPTVEPVSLENPPRLIEIASSTRYRLVDEQVGANTLVQQSVTGDAAAWGEDVKIPEGFPSVLPQYVAARTRAAIVTNEQQASLVQTTYDTVEKVAAWIISYMQSQGFRLDSDQLAGQARSLQFSRGQVRVVVSVSRTDQLQGTVISSTFIDQHP